WTPEDADEDEDFDDDGHYLKDNFVRITEEEPITGQIDYSEESIALGKVGFEKTCSQCHGETGRGNITSGKRLADDWGNRIWPRNLTQPWTWRASNIEGVDEESRKETIRNIYRRLSIGIFSTPMPAHRSTNDDPDPVSLDDRWHIANYVYSLRENLQGEVIKGVKVAGVLPTDVTDIAWNNATAVTLRLVPNIIKEERLFTPLNETITVRVLYNEQEIAFLLEVDDRTDSRPGEPVATQIQDENLEMYSDAFAIQVPKTGAFTTIPMVEKPLYRHGDKKHPTTIYYWNAGSIEPEVAALSMILDDNTLTANGKWMNGKWKVLMKRPLIGNDAGDVTLTNGQFLPISFANWDGNNGEVGSKHTLSSWYWLVLPPEINNNKLYGIPLGVGFLTFLLGIIVVRSQR
ncbi:MAG: hypothetical protein KAG43_10535, partial [Candidatus Marithrix sp.]|nr:hypothetical protein [Candidatus Marithrix sp.]